MGTRRSSDTTWLWIVPLALVLPPALGWSARTLLASEGGRPAVVAEGIALTLPADTPALQSGGHPARLAAAVEATGPRR